MDNQVSGRRMQIRLSTSIFGLKFKVSSFISFMAWTGMTFCVLMILASLALLTIPTDGTFQLSLPDRRYEQNLPLFYTMYGLGAVLMAMSLPLLTMYYLLRKRNVEKDVKGVMQMLKIICYVQSVLELLTYFSFIPFEMWISVGTIVLPVLLVIFTSLKIHGIRTRNPKYIKAFIIFQYTLYILWLIGVFIGSIYFSATLSHFWIFLLAVVFMMCSTFIWIFDMGFIITLNTLLEEKVSRFNIM